MKSVLIVLDSLEQWAPYYQTESVITAEQYLQDNSLSNHAYQVINLCQRLSYSAEGYYCSLLAQARNHKIIPSVETLNRLDAGMTIRLNSFLLKYCNCQKPPQSDADCKEFHKDLFFGKCEDPKFSRQAQFIFSQYPAPLLRVTFSGSQPSQAVSIRTLALSELDDSQQTFFANRLDEFNKKIWRQPRSRKSAIYDLAIFHDPDEAFPPSNKSALNLFLSEAKKMNINAELVTEKDTARLMEFDALFIRQTTAVNHLTYQLAQTAQQADMVVMDDPVSIIRCTNKVYLKELLDRFSIKAPQSTLLFKSNPQPYSVISEHLGKTMVIKIPDGSFSQGVSCVANEREYNELLATIFSKSAIVLAQEFVPTEFDWRIGILNGECIYACKYFMARGHWQIYHHKSTGSSKTGSVEIVPVHLVPKQVVRVAVKASAAIGKGLYGVDIKCVGHDVLVIEVNDNPSIDHGVEDGVLGPELYRIILREFTRRLNEKRKP